MILSVYYLIQLYYNIYYEFYQKFYGEAPYFLNDFVLLKEVMPIFLREVSFGYATNFFLPILGFLAITGLIIYLIKRMIYHFEKAKLQMATSGLFSSCDNMVAANNVSITISTTQKIILEELLIE